MIQSDQRVTHTSMTKTSTVREFPPTTAFPANPTPLSREELQAHYLEMRRNYKGLYISRGMFISKSRNLQQHLIDLAEEREKLLVTLKEKAAEKQSLEGVIQDIEKIRYQEQQLITEFRQEYEAVKVDRGSLLDKFNRMMRAIYRLLNTDLTPNPTKSAKPPEAKKLDPDKEYEEEFSDQSAKGTNKWGD